MIKLNLIKDMKKKRLVKKDTQVLEQVKKVLSKADQNLIVMVRN